MHISYFEKVKLFRKTLLGISLVVQWLRLPASNAGDTSSIPGWGTKIPTCHVVWPKKKLEKLFYMLRLFSN